MAVEPEKLKPKRNRCEWAYSLEFRVFPFRLNPATPRLATFHGWIGRQQALSHRVAEGSLVDYGDLIRIIIISLLFAYWKRMHMQSIYRQHILIVVVVVSLRHESQV